MKKLLGRDLHIAIRGFNRPHTRTQWLRGRRLPASAMAEAMLEFTQHISQRYHQPDKPSPKVKKTTLTIHNP